MTKYIEQEEEKESIEKKLKLNQVSIDSEVEIGFLKESSIHFNEDKFIQIKTKKGSIFIPISKVRSIVIPKGQ